MMSPCKGGRGRLGMMSPWEGGREGKIRYDVTRAEEEQYQTTSETN